MLGLTEHLNKDSPAGTSSVGMGVVRGWVCTVYRAGYIICGVWYNRKMWAPLQVAGA